MNSAVKTEKNRHQRRKESAGCRRKMRRLGRDGFPVHALPKLARDIVNEMHQAIQAPIELCAQSVLFAMALCTQALADLRLPGPGIIPLSLFFLSIALSGERKSACDTAAMKAVTEVESDLYDAYTDGLLDRAFPLFVSDVTIEGLDSLFNDGAVNLALCNDEGGQVIAGRGAIDENKIGFLASLSKRWDGKAVKRIRKGDGLWWSKGRRLSCHLMLQPYLAKTLLADPVWKNQGLLARFLFVWPESRIGFRPLSNWTPKGLAARKAFDDRVDELLKLGPPCSGAPKSLSLPVIELTLAASKLWADFYQEIESQLGPECPMEAVREFGAKLAEHCGRIAGVIAVFENGPQTTVEEKHVQKAVEIARFYRAETLRIFGKAEEERAIAPVNELKAWLAKRSDPLISTAEILQLGPNQLRNKKALAPVLAHLVAANVLKPVPGGATRNGKKRREVYEIRRSGEVGGL